MTLPQDNITINAVAPTCTITPLLPQAFLAPIFAANLPVSSAGSVGLALVYSATAHESRRVENYGKDQDPGQSRARWNGRVILTMGDQYSEIEGPIADSRTIWFGAENTRLTRAQQAVTDTRKDYKDTGSA